MNIIKTGEIHYLEPVGKSQTWYWGMDYTHGDLYEAEELYKNNHPVSPNRLIFVKYPEGILIEPIKASEGQYLGTPSLLYENHIYTLLVDFVKEEIQILSFCPDEVVNGSEAKVVEVLPLSCVEDCYNLLFRAEPIMLTRQSSDQYFEIIWSSESGPMKVGFQMEEHGGFSHADGERLYFSNWWETEEPKYEYHEEVIIRNFKGEIVERIAGSIFEIRPGEYWVLE